VTHRHLLYIGLSLSFFAYFFGFTQTEAPKRSVLLAQYSNADKLYDQALFISSQETYDEEKEEVLNRQALHAFQLLAKLLPVQKSIYDSLAFFVYFKMGELHHYFEMPDTALICYRQSIELKNRTKFLADSLLFRPLLFTGIIHYSQNHFDSAMHFLQAAEKVKSQYNIKLNDEERLYNNLGALYYSTGNFRQAKNYFQKAADVLSENHPYYKELLVNYYVNLGSALTTLEEYDAANEIYQKIISYGVTTDVILHNIGLINLNLGAAEKALNYFRKVDYRTSRIVSLYNDIGLAYYNINQPDSALHYYQKAIEENKKWNKANPNVAHGLALKNTGDLLKASNPLKALDYHQQAIHQFYPSYKSQDIKTNPNNFSGLFSYINLFNTLSAKAEAYHELYSTSGRIDWAKEELKTYQAAFKLISYVERSYDSDEARLFLNNIKYVIHNKPIDIAYELFLKTQDKHFLEEAYFFDQRNKASVLSFNQQLHAGLNTKDSLLLKKERSLKTELTRLSLTANKLTDSLQIDKINAAIREAEIDLGKVQEQIADVATQDFNRIPSIKELQKNILDDKAAIISFHLSDSNLLGITITKNDLLASRLPFNKENIIAVTSALRQPLSDQNSFNTQALPGSFFNPLKEIERLIIIPDDELNYLPFETLKDAGNRFLVERFSIQYQYSTALLNEKKMVFDDNRSLALAPFAKDEFFSNSDSFSALPFSGKEIQNLKGKKLIGTEATRQAFMNNLSDQSIIHFATHAQADAEEADLSFIAFAPSNSPENNLLYAKEIYDLPLEKTGLVILSACETGSGYLHKGEGIMSLSRAFTYAGCPNIITSLWKADDESTAYIISRFYDHLNKSQPVDIALQQAKLDYLNDKNIHPRKKHPAYWAHLIYVGNYSQKEKSYWWLLLIPVALFALAFVIKKSRQKRDHTFHR